jgi:GMP synthase (glutamine-hydrolysing)
VQINYNIFRQNEPEKAQIEFIKQLLFCLFRFKLSLKLSEKLDILRAADAIFREELQRFGLTESCSQYFAALTNMHSVGVMGDARSYDCAVALRAVTTEDFMTADWARLPYDLLDRVSNRIVNEVPGVNRVFYDVTAKPPATVEYE